MPHKFNASRRSKIPKQKYRVTNWASYNESLRRRGDLTVWVSDEGLRLWSAPRRTTRGGQRIYSDLAIEICLTVGMVYRQRLRQTQGFMRSIAILLGVKVPVPDFSTLSRRGKGLALPEERRLDSSTPIHLVVDSTGLKVFGEGEWLERKHQTRAKRKRWRKLHLGLDLVCGKIVCDDLTTEDVGDPTALPGLLDQIDSPVGQFLADGAYDGGPTRDLLFARFGETLEVAIPPPKNAALSPEAAQTPTDRDRQIAEIAAHGRIAWQRSSGYNQRSRVETKIGRWKAVIGTKLRARTLKNQKTETKIGVRILNRMTGLGRPTFERTA
ncbi:IS5 family transposase [Ruegeria hyattellae]|uniref:IS5 family transposase n=1 Tax=Ruegeria hyattellae TaxID=3233337 RepID=UPI00355BA9F6